MGAALVGALGIALAGALGIQDARPPPSGAARAGAPVNVGAVVLIAEALALAACVRVEFALVAGVFVASACVAATPVAAPLPFAGAGLVCTAGAPVSVAVVLGMLAFVSVSGTLASAEAFALAASIAGAPVRVAAELGTVTGPPAFAGAGAVTLGGPTIVVRAVASGEVGVPTGTVVVRATAAALVPVAAPLSAG